MERDGIVHFGEERLVTIRTKPGKLLPVSGGSVTRASLDAVTDVDVRRQDHLLWQVEQEWDCRPAHTMKATTWAG